jgi:hypothetical protein
MKILLIMLVLLNVFMSVPAQKVFSVEYHNQADVKVFVVKYENQAGWREKKKMHLM